MIENKEFALEIAGIAALLIEQESGLSSALLETNLDTEFYQNKYLIKLKVIPKESGKNYLVIESKESNFLIEMLDGELISAISIEDEDIEYWQQIKSAIYS